MSESQERMMAIVAPEKLDGFLAVDGEVGCRDERARRGHRRPAASIIIWHGEEIVDVDPSHRRGRRPGLRAPGRLPDVDRRAAGRLGEPRSRRPADARRPARAVRSARRAARTSPTRRGSPTSTTTTCIGNTALSLPRRRRHGPRRRAVRPRLRDRDRLQRPLLPARPATRARKLALAEAYRNVAVTGAVPDRRHRLPQLRQPREPRGHVAVLARPSRASPTDASSSASPSPAATSSFYNQTGDVPIYPTPVVAVLGVDRRRRPPHPVGLAGRRATTSTCSASPRPSSTARRGRASCTATSADARRRSTSPARSALAELLHAAAHRGPHRLGATTSRDGGLAQRARRGRPALRRRRARLARRAHGARRRRRRDRALLASRPAASSWPCRARTT